jgi:hypothetical protein
MTPDTIVHRLGPASVAGFHPKAAELALTTPGVSLLTGGSPAEAMAAMRAAYPRARKWQAACVVSSATVAAIQGAGFDVIADPTPNFPNHARLIHPLGAAGFTDENLAALAGAFTETVV